MNGRNQPPEWYDTFNEDAMVEPPEDVSHEDYEEMLVDAELENQFLDKHKEEK